MHFSNREQISFFPDEIMLAQAKAELGKLHNSALTLYSEIMSRFHAFEELVILPFYFRGFRCMDLDLVYVQFIG